MSFDTLERSRFQGRPVRLFEFWLQGQVKRYAQGDRDFTVGEGETAKIYVAAQISRSEIKQTAERAKDTLTITVGYRTKNDAPGAPPATQSLGDWWRPYVPSDTVRVVCLAAHFGDASPPQVEWVGEVVGPKFSDVDLQLSCTPTADLDRARNQGPKWQVNCWKTTYSTGLAGCNLVAGPLAREATLTAVAGATVTSPDFADPPRALVGGWAQWLISVDGEDVIHKVAITAHTGTTLTLEDATDLVIGSKIMIYTIPLTVTGPLTSASGLTLVAAVFADALFSLAGGSLSWTREDGVVERRTIMAHSGTGITLLSGAPDLAADLVVTAKPGCPHSWEACLARGNTINFGGAVYKPVKNPLAGSGVSMSWG